MGSLHILSSVLFSHPVGDSHEMCTSEEDVAAIWCLPLGKRKFLPVRSRPRGLLPRFQPQLCDFQLASLSVPRWPCVYLFLSVTVKK